MKISRKIPAAIAFALSFGALAADAPATLPLATRGGTQPAPNLGTSPVTKPTLALRPAPRVSEMRAVPGPDGELHIVCREVPNPKLAQAAADAEHPTP